MKTITIIGGIIVVLIGVFFVFNNYIYQQKQADDAVAPEVPTPEEAYLLETEGLLFTYPTSADGYVLEELPLLSETEPLPTRMIRLVPTADWEDEQTRIGGEGSPAWLLTVYPNEQEQTSAQWYTNHPRESNSDFAISTSEMVQIDGREAVTFTVDGLYRAQVYVLAENNHVFVIYAAYLDEQSPTYLDLPDWLASFDFDVVVPVETSDSMRVDIRVACESALAYMTFLSGDDADAFVADCIAGKHPEVIERYIESVGVGGASM
jgi:hypothetical protein